MKPLSLLLLTVQSGLMLAPAAVVAQTQPTPPTADQVLQACANNQADTLPNPFLDISPSDWAYKATLTLYYCGAYRGAIPPEQYRQFLEQKRI